MTSLAVRLLELDDEQLEEFTDLFATQKSSQYLSVERVGGANDKGRDVIDFWRNPGTRETGTSFSANEKRGE